MTTDPYSTYVGFMGTSPRAAYSKNMYIPSKFNGIIMHRDRFVLGTSIFPKFLDAPLPHLNSAQLF